MYQIKKVGGGTLNVNGILVNYTVANGQTVEAGNFVTLTSSNTIKKVECIGLIL